MEPSGEKISVSRNLTEQEIELVNECKELGQKIELYVKKLESMSEEIDPRWVSIGRTSLQKGFMSLTRAITKPNSFA